LILNLQDKYIVNTSRLSEYVGELRRALGLGKRDCNVCLVNDREIRRLNTLFRGKERATDVLSFPWEGRQRLAHPRTKRGRTRRRQTGSGPDARAKLEFRNHLGDIVISLETAKRNARQEGHSTLNEIRWLILHGLLHLLGYDHESDQGEMIRLELALRTRLGISGE
jgi:probable rRNA maturation factor